MTVLISKSLKTELYRKAIHLSSLWMPLFIYRADKSWSMILFAVLALGNLFFEYAAYARVSYIGGWFRRMFIKTLRHKEICQKKFVPSGSFYILTAALICSVCFSKPVGATAMTIMLISDSCAALCGKFYGRIRFKNGKSAEGTLAFAASVILVIFMLNKILTVSSTAAAVVVITATAVEFFEKKIKVDDNLTIPLVSGLIFNLFSL